MRSNSRGFMLIEMVVAIVVTAILMAMAAPLIVHLIDAYDADAQGADLVAAAGPAVWRMQWDARNAWQMAISKGCSRLTLSESNGQNTVTYRYQGGQLQRNGSLVLGFVTRINGTCPFQTVKSAPQTILYGFIYTGASSQGRLTIQGALSAYGY